MIGGSIQSSLFQRGVRLAVLLGVGLAAVAVVPSPARAAVMPPNGRANYVIALMRNIGTESTVRLAEYSLRSDGTARADYWAWNARTPTSYAATGFTTAGCARTCGVYTAAGYQNAPKQFYGTWKVSGSDLTVQWTSPAQTERWKFSNQSTATRLELASHPTATDGFGWGSTFGFTSGVNTTTIYEGHGVYSGPSIDNNYGTITRNPNAIQVIHEPDKGNPVRRCSATCLNLSTSTTDSTGALIPSNKVYLAGTGRDRKMYFNHQLRADNPDPCIGGGGEGKGHLKPALQIIDDSGKFRGLIVAEASVYSLKYGGDILGIWDLNDI